MRGGQNEKISADEFIRLFKELGPAKLAKRLDTNISVVFGRRARLEKKLGMTIKGPEHRNSYRFEPDHHPERISLKIMDGIVLVGSDAHYWPGLVSTAHRAMCHLSRKLRPFAVVMNGDVIDAPSIGRHPPIGWEYRPTLASEIEAAQERLSEIAESSPKAQLVWPIGNHDARFNTRLAVEAPEFAKVNGVHLKDHFEAWSPCWSCWINDDVVIKHRFKGGTHATHNNTLWSGKSTVTGHLHSLNVWAFSDYDGTRFGIDTGTMAAPYGPQFLNYTEDNPKNWRSGFAVLTFKDGKLIWPELLFVRDEKTGTVEFRGERFRV